MNEGLRNFKRNVILGQLRNQDKKKSELGLNKMHQEYREYRQKFQANEDSRTIQVMEPKETQYKEHSSPSPNKIREQRESLQKQQQQGIYDKLRAKLQIKKLLDENSSKILGNNDQSRISPVRNMRKQQTDITNIQQQSSQSQAGINEVLVNYFQGLSRQDRSNLLSYTNSALQNSQQNDQHKPNSLQIDSPMLIKESSNPNIYDTSISKAQQLYAKKHRRNLTAFQSIQSTQMNSASYQFSGKTQNEDKELLLPPLQIKQSPINNANLGLQPTPQHRLLKNLKTDALWQTIDKSTGKHQRTKTDMEYYARHQDEQLISRFEISQQESYINSQSPQKEISKGGAQLFGMIKPNIHKLVASQMQKSIASQENSVRLAKEKQIKENLQKQISGILSQSKDQSLIKCDLPYLKSVQKNKQIKIESDNKQSDQESTQKQLNEQKKTPAFDKSKLKLNLHLINQLQLQSPEKLKQSKNNDRYNRVKDDKDKSEQENSQFFSIDESLELLGNQLNQLPQKALDMRQTTPLEIEFKIQQKIQEKMKIIKESNISRYQQH